MALEIPDQNLTAALASHEAILKGLMTKGFVREALLIRMILAGLFLKDAVKLKKQQALISMFGRFARFDVLYNDKSLKYSYIIQEYFFIDKMVGFADRLKEIDVFGSNKTNRPITTHEAERSLKRAVNALGGGKGITFRNIRYLGQQLMPHIVRAERGAFNISMKKIEAEKKQTSVVENAVTRADWIFKKLFKNENDRDDAIQTT